MLVDSTTSGFESLAAQPRAALLIVHGLAEYAGRYRDLAATLASRGISCFVDDLNLEAASLARRSPELPLFVWGHSMGAIVTIGAVLTARHRWRGVITSSNSLEVFRRGPNPLNPFFRLGARLLPHIRIPLGLDSR